MVREGTYRRRRYEDSLQPQVVARKFEAQKDLMVEQQGEILPQLAIVERKVKVLCEAQGIPSFQVAQYVNFGREMYSLSQRFTSLTLANEAQNLVVKWQSRGLLGSLLSGIAGLFGVTPTPSAEAQADREISFVSAEAMDPINVIGPTNTTERQITVALPPGSSLVRAALYALITAMNNTATAQKIGFQVQARPAGGSWSPFFNQANVIGFGAVDGATAAPPPLGQDVSSVVTGPGTFGFRVAITLSAAQSVRFTTQYVLIVTYRTAA